MVYLFRPLVGYFCYAKFVMSYPALSVKLGSFGYTRLFGHTWLDRASMLLCVKYRYHYLSVHSDTVSLSEKIAVLLCDGA